MQLSESPGLKVKSPIEGKPFSSSPGGSLFGEIMLEKRCSKCRETKSTKEFHKNKSMKDGLCNQCKACSSKNHIKNRERNNARGRASHAANREERLEKQRNYYACHRIEIGIQKKSYNKKNKVVRAIKDKANYQEYPEKTHARSAVNYAIKTGRLIRPNKCSDCGKECKPEGHHWSYLEKHWLDVEWLCSKCHNKEEHKPKEKEDDESER